MLSCMEERIQELNTEIGVICFGQEFNPSTFAIAKADMMIRGGDPNNMRFGDTLSEDQFSGYQFQYIISNPPFGIDWKREKAAVEAEAKKGELGRFAPGLPKISDGQQLFVLNGLSKLAPNGKMAIIQNGSPLFSGDAGSGPSEIRRYSTGITASRLRLYPQGFFSILFPVPPRKEQQEIAVYLNKKIPQIDQLIIKKEKFVNELKSYKRSLIYEYVTGKKEVPES